VVFNVSMLFAMDRHSRQSSLPSSLIPHLYSAPRNSSTRTTLTDDRHLAALPDLSMLPSQQRVFSDPRQPSYNFPPPPAPRGPVTSWREGEPGPSRQSRGTNYPARVSARAFEQDSSFLMRRDVERDLYYSYSQRMLSLDNISLMLISLLATPYPPSHTFQPPSLLTPCPDDLSPSSSSFPFDRHDTYPSMGSLSISAPSSSHRISPESSDVHSMYRSETRSLDFGSNDDESSQKGKRRRQQSLDTDDTSRKSRKTAVACNFCRGTFYNY
jgi:hypothetical protein